MDFPMGERAGVGSIKKIFGRQREPYGFLTIHHPPEVNGMEAVFYLKDVLLKDEERRLLQGGLLVRFVFSHKPLDRMKAPCPYKASQVRMQDPMEYNGTVARSSTGALVVFLDTLFRQVRVPQLGHSASAGDRCTVVIPWRQMAKALKKNRDPVGELIAIHRGPGEPNSFGNCSVPLNGLSTSIHKMHHSFAGETTTTSEAQTPGALQNARESSSSSFSCPSSPENVPDNDQDSAQENYSSPSKRRRTRSNTRSNSQGGQDGGYSTGNGFNANGSFTDYHRQPFSSIGLMASKDRRSSGSSFSSMGGDHHAMRASAGSPMFSHKPRSSLGESSTGSATPRPDDIADLSYMLNYSVGDSPFTPREDCGAVRRKTPRSSNESEHSFTGNMRYFTSKMDSGSSLLSGHDENRGHYQTLNDSFGFNASSQNNGGGNIGGETAKTALRNFRGGRFSGGSTLLDTSLDASLFNSPTGGSNSIHSIWNDNMNSSNLNVSSPGNLSFFGMNNGGTESYDLMQDSNPRRSSTETGIADMSGGIGDALDASHSSLSSRRPLWNDDEWYEQTIRVAESALAGR